MQNLKQPTPLYQAEIKDDILVFYEFIYQYYFFKTTNQKDINKDEYEEKEEKEVVDKLVRYLGQLEYKYTCYTTLQKQTISKFKINMLKRRISIYAFECLNSFIFYKDKYAIECMLNQYMGIDEFCITLFSMMIPSIKEECNDLVFFCSSIEEIDNYLSKTTDFWFNWNEKDNCDDPNVHMFLNFYNIQKEQKEREQKEREQKEKEKSLQDLKDKIKELGLNPNDLKKLLSTS